MLCVYLRTTPATHTCRYHSRRLRVEAALQFTAVAQQSVDAALLELAHVVRL